MLKKDVNSNLMPLIKITIIEKDGHKEDFVLPEDYSHGDATAESFFRNVANMMDMRIDADGRKSPMPFSTCINGLDDCKLVITRTQDVFVERE